MYANSVHLYMYYVYIIRHLFAGRSLLEDYPCVNIVTNDTQSDLTINF